MSLALQSLQFKRLLTDGSPHSSVDHIMAQIKRAAGGLGQAVSQGIQSLKHALSDHAAYEREAALTPPSVS